MIYEDSNTVIESLLQPANETATCIRDRELNHRTLSGRNGFRQTIPHQSRVASAAGLSNLVLAQHPVPPRLTSSTNSQPEMNLEKSITSR